LLFDANSAICQLYQGQNKLILTEVMTRSALYYVANSPKQQIAVKMSPHSDTLSWFRSPIISLNVQDYLIFDMLEVSIMIVVFKE